jgi:hypothetical protein
MLSGLRRAITVAALIVGSASAAQAQVRVEELRVDLLNFQTANGNSALGFGIPGSLALGVYLNDKLALEPTLGLNFFSPEVGNSSTRLTFGVFAPFYVSGDRGHNGIFLSPGVLITKITDVEAATDFGADIGYKSAVSPKISMAFAATLRDGDSYSDAVLGARFGLSVFWR